MNRLVRYKICIISSILLLSSAKLAAQKSPATEPGNFTKPIEVLPPSPNAASLGRYGGMDISPANGMVRFSVPIFNLQSSNLALPLSLNYAGGGLRVDELASRVGTSWSLNAGGVITRTVFGSIDEQSRRLAPPPGFPARTKATLDYLKSLTGFEAGNFDAEPDLFSFNFNGNAGRFILDDNLNPVLLSHSNLKIEKDFSSADWNFRVTTADGVQYFFGGAGARETTNKYASGTGCGKSYPSPAVTAWYLNKIIHPNRDTLYFSYSSLGLNYKTGVSQSAVAKMPSVSECKHCPTIPATNCFTWLTTQVVMLQEITSSGGSKIRFHYINRLDLDDKLLSKIEIYNSSNNIVRVFDLEYRQAESSGFTNIYTEPSFKYRPFLVRFIERSADSKLTRSHQFYYNKEDQLAPRLSFAQDYYGFFNGKRNGSLLTCGTETWLQSRFPQARANRNPDPEYSTRGMLSKIVYPTGGEDTILYEGNTVYERVEILPPTKTVTAQAISNDLPGGPSKTVRSDTVLISYKQDEVILYASVSGNNDDPIHNKGIIKVFELPSNRAVFNEVISQGHPIQRPLYLARGASYYIEVSAAGRKTAAAASFTCNVGESTYENRNVNAAGVRVKKIITRNPLGQESVRKYTYAKLATPNTSSAGYIFRPRYYRMLTVKIPCSDPNAIPGCGYANCDNYVLYSNPQNNIYVYPDAPVAYRHVVESFGNDYESGGIEYEYTVAPDIPGNNLIGAIAGAPLTSNGWKNGREVHRRVFKKKNGTYIPVQETFTHYKDDSRVDKTFSAYIASKKFEAICQGDPPMEEEFEAFDLTSYAYLRKWSYVDSVRTRTYDDQGQRYLQQLSVTEYVNPAHVLPTKVTTTSSEGKTETVANYYAPDLRLTGTEESARQKMVATNIIAPVLLQQFATNNKSTTTLKTGYYISPEGLVLPQYQSMQTNGASMEKRVEFHKYSPNGNLMEQSKVNDAHEVYLWGYNHQYPVARITGSDYATVSAMIDPSVQAVLDQPASDEQLRTTLDKLRTRLAGQALVTTYTYQPLVGMTSETGPAGRTTYYEYDGFGRLKLIRDQHSKVLKLFCYNYAGQREDCGGLIFYNAPKSQVFTRNNCPPGTYGGQVTYSVPARKYSAGTQPAADAMAQADINANGQNYANQHGSCLYGNVAKSQVFTRNNCPVGGTGAKVTYTVPAGKYKATTQEAANVLAQNDINANGQNYANQHGTCTFRNAPKSQPFTKNNCTAPYKGSQVTYLVQEGKYTSVISLEDANQKAQNDINANGQNYANTHGTCVIVYAKISYQNIVNKPNIERRADVYVSFFSDINCTTPFAVTNLRVNYKIESTRCGDEAGSTKDYSVVCNGTTSLVAKNAQLYWNGGDYYHCWRYEYAVTMGTGYLPCGFAYRNAAISKTFTRNNCGAGYLPGSATYTVAAGKHTSPLSQEAANALAQADMNANGQNYANVHAPCHKIYYSEEKKETFIRNNCPSGHKPGSITYIVAAKKYTSLINQDDANAKAQQDINTNGQAYANSHASCTPSPLFHSKKDSGDFIRNNCGAGYIGTSVRYIVPEGKYTSTIDQEDANRKARADVNANGQNYANAHGTCNKLVIYARVSYENIKAEGNTRKTADVYIRFYSNASCTTPYSVANLRVNYRLEEKRCHEDAWRNTNYSILCNGTATLVKKGAILYQYGGDQYHCWIYGYVVAPGSGYTNK